MNPQFHSPPWAPQLPLFPPPTTAFWNSSNVHNHLKELHDTLHLAKSMQKEVEMLIKMKESKDCYDERDASVDKFLKFIEDNKIDLESQESFALRAVNDLIAKLRVELEPFRVIADEKVRWEEKSAALKLANKLQKYKRNKIWRKRKRIRVAEKLAKEKDEFERIDKEIDEWRAKEIAKDIANHKVEKMKEIAKIKAQEERKRLESELEMVLIVEKLQELRSLRIQKLKKQGHFLPEEDDKFLERVKVAVEEEERQIKAAADTDATKDAIKNMSEESRKNISEEIECINVEEKDVIKTDFTEKESKRLYDQVTNLPMEFYHYYYGSNRDMGTLIEVRRTWDAYIRHGPGGSRIPGHWVQPPVPADEIWASYLVKRD